MERKKSIIITAIIFLVSVLAIAFGICGDMLRSFVYKSQIEFYPTKVTDNDIGKKYRIPVFEGTQDIKLDNLYLLAVTDPDVTEDNYISFWFGLDMKGTALEKTETLLSLSENCEECYITGILRKYDKEYEQKVKSSLKLRMEEFYDYIKEYFPGTTREKFVEDELRTCLHKRMHTSLWQIFTNTSLKMFATHKYACTFSPCIRKNYARKSAHISCEDRFLMPLLHIISRSPMYLSSNPLTEPHI